MCRGLNRECARELLLRDTVNGIYNLFFRLAVVRTLDGDRGTRREM